MKAKHCIPLFFLAIVLFIPSLAHSYLNINIKSMNENPVPFYMVNCLSDSKSQWVADIINKSIVFDLQNSGEFAVSSGYKREIDNINYQTDLTKTNNLLGEYLDYNFLLLSKVNFINNYYKVEYLLWDVYNNKVLASGGFKIKDANENDIYYTAHYISNAIYKSIVGENGYFNSMISFVANKKIYIMDYDGRNQEAITNGINRVFTPEFSNNNAYLAYIELKDGVSNIYIYDLLNKKNYKLGNFDGLVLAPRFSPDNKYMLFAISKNGSTNIFRLNLVNKNIKQLTYSYSINIPGSYSPNGNNIVFTSDREGSPQIYIMDVDGSHIKRISELKGSYYTPRWSPRGDLISFTKIMKTGFYIGIMNTDGSNEKIIANDLFAEAPNWSSNGRSMIYQFMYDKDKYLYASYLISIDKLYKLLINPFDNIKDPILSNNKINNKIVENQYSLY